MIKHALEREYDDYAPVLARGLVRAAATLLPKPVRADHREEWLSHLHESERDGRGGGIIRALGIVSAACWFAVYLRWAQRAEIYGRPRAAYVLLAWGVAGVMWNLGMARVGRFPALVHLVCAAVVALGSTLPLRAEVVLGHAVVTLPRWVARRSAGRLTAWCESDLRLLHQQTASVEEHRERFVDFRTRFEHHAVRTAGFLAGSASRNSGSAPEGRLLVDEGERLGVEGRRLVRNSQVLESRLKRKLAHHERRHRRWVHRVALLIAFEWWMATSPGTRRPEWLGG